MFISNKVSKINLDANGSQTKKVKWSQGEGQRPFGEEREWNEDLISSDAAMPNYSMTLSLPSQ